MPQASEPPELTMGDIWRRRERLEAQATMLLGRFLFGFSRLEHSVLLLIQSLRREKWIGSTSGNNLNAYVEAARKFAATTTELPPIGRDAYLAWLVELDNLRFTRNSLVHGRWMTDGMGTKIQNVVTDPQSGDQTMVEYTLEQFEALSKVPASLQEQLSRLRTKWPT